MEDNKDIKINKTRLTKAEGGNLMPPETKEEARERGRNGGIASGIAKRKKKTAKQFLKDILEMKPTQKEREFLENYGLITPDGTSETGDEINKGLVLAATVYREALKGNPRFVNMALSLQDEINKHEDNTTTNIIEALNGSAEKDWETEAPVEPNKDPVSEENKKMVEEAIGGEE